MNDCNKYMFWTTNMVFTYYFNLFVSLVLFFLHQKELDSSVCKIDVFKYYKNRLNICIFVVFWTYSLLIWKSKDSMYLREKICNNSYIIEEIQQIRYK